MMFVEVLDRHGEVRTRAQVSADTFTIGRAYDNDLILDDAFVAPHHLRIERTANGALQLRDLGSVNGLHSLADKRRVDALELAEDTRVRIGHTQLRFRSDAFAVAEAIPMSAAESPMRHATAFYVAFVTAGGLLALEAQLSTFGETQPAQLITAVLATLLGAFAWTGMWAFAGRIATRRANFYAHGSAVMAALAALLLVNNVSEYIEFSVSPPLAEVLLQAAIAAIVIALLYRQSRLVSRASARQTLLSVSALVAVLLGSGWLVQYATDAGYSGRLDYPAALKAPPFRLQHGVTPEAFVSQAAELRDALDALRKKKD